MGKKEGDWNKIAKGRERARKAEEELVRQWESRSQEGSGMEANVIRHKR